MAKELSDPAAAAERGLGQIAQQPRVPLPSVSTKFLALVLLALMCLGTLNFLTFKIMFTAYGDKYSSVCLSALLCFTKSCSVDLASCARRAVEMC